MWDSLLQYWIPGWGADDVGQPKTYRSPASFPRVLGDWEEVTRASRVTALCYISRGDLRVRLTESGMCGGLSVVMASVLIHAD